MSKCLWAGGSDRVEQKMVLLFSLLSCELSVSMKENPDRKMKMRFIHWDARQILRRSHSYIINGTKTAIFFLPRALTQHTFTFYSQFLFEIKHKVRLSKTESGIVHFWFCFVFIKVYIFLRQNAWTLWL